MRRGSVLAAVLGVVLTACSNGESLLQAGNDVPPPPPTTGPPVTAAPGETLAPTTTAPPVTTTTTPLSSLPPCPVEALAAITSPVEITFWHAMSAENEKALTELTDAYNASQQKVRVRLENQGGYKQTLDKYSQSSQGSRPDMVMLPEYTVQQMADSDSVIPVGARISRYMRGSSRIGRSSSEPHPMKAESQSHSAASSHRPGGSASMRSPDPPL